VAITTIPMFSAQVRSTSDAVVPLRDALTKLLSMSLSYDYGPNRPQLRRILDILDTLDEISTMISELR
jgi:hypothetical protein